MTMVDNSVRVHALVDAIEACLIAADELGLTEAGVHLNEALVSLNGEGLAPAFPDYADVA